MGSDLSTLEALGDEGACTGGGPGEAPAGWPVGSLAALDRLAHGVVITDGASRPLLVNASARAILSEDDGLSIDAGRLSAACARETAGLRWTVAAVGAAANGEAGGRAISVSRPSLRRPLTIVVAPLRARPAGGNAGAAAIMFISDPERATPVPAAFLQQAYGLTPAEAAVAIEIARGEGLGTVVAKLGISRSTARTHLQRAFEKTGTRRQAKLAWLIAESWAGLRLDGMCAARADRRAVARRG